MLKTETQRDVFQVLRARTLLSLSHGTDMPQRDKSDSDFAAFLEGRDWELIGKFVSNKV